MLRLYYAPGACSLAPHIVLEEIGAPFEPVQVDFAAGEQRSAAYLALNPKGRVPLLVGPEGPLTENVAILNYLAEIAPEKGLLPADAWARAQARSFLVWLSGTVHGQAFASVFRPARFAQDAAAHEAIKAQGMADLPHHFDVMEASVAGRDYAFGAFSIVDPMLLVLSRWGVRIGLDRARWPGLAAHAERVAARPAAARALAREGIRIDG